VYICYSSTSPFKSNPFSSYLRCPLKCLPRDNWRWLAGASKRKKPNSRPLARRQRGREIFLKAQGIKSDARNVEEEERRAS